MTDISKLCHDWYTVYQTCHGTEEGARPGSVLVLDRGGQALNAH